MTKRRKRPSDANQLGKLVADIATGQEEDREDITRAAAYGRRGGLKGGKARANNLSPDRRKEIAKKAAEARWSKDSAT